MDYLEIPESEYKSKLSHDLIFYYQPTLYQIKDIMNCLLSLRDNKNSIFYYVPTDIINEIGKAILNITSYPKKTSEYRKLQDIYDIKPDAYVIEWDNHCKFTNSSWKYLLDDYENDHYFYWYGTSRTNLMRYGIWEKTTLRSYAEYIYDYTIQPLFLGPNRLTSVSGCKARGA